MAISKEQRIPVYFHNYIWKPDRRCTCDVTLRRVLSTNVTEEKQEVLHIPRVCL